MKLLKILIIVLTLLYVPNFIYSYNKTETSSKAYIYIPQKDEIKELKILVLFHNYINKTNPNNKKYTDFNFKQEVENWQFEAEKENFFIIGFDLYYNSFVREEALDTINNRILREIKKLKESYNQTEAKVYIAGTQYGAAMALLFNLRYDNFDGCLCMNCSKPINLTANHLKFAKGKKFYFFHAEKNSLMTIGKINSLKNRLIQKEAIAEVFEYKDLTNKLSSSAYSDAIDKIKD